MHSAIYSGKLSHSRLLPRKHQFFYNIFLLWLDLDELDDLDETVKGFAYNRWSWVQFNNRDYLGKNSLKVKYKALETFSELAGKPMTGKVFFMGQPRILGLYFSPVNFYFLQQDGEFTHMLAEVSNTPWNERHCYLVDMKHQANTDKAFFVSPFNPMDMQYHWSIPEPGENKFDLGIDCYGSDEACHLRTRLVLDKAPLNSEHLRQRLQKIPSMTLKTLAGIYWEAVKLILKKVPYYRHPSSVKS